MASSVLDLGTGYVTPFDGSLVWEMEPFIDAKDFHKFEFLEGKEEIILRTSLIFELGFSGLKFVDPAEGKPEYELLKKYESVDYMHAIILDPFTSRIHAHLGNPEFADSLINMIDLNEDIVLSIPVHRVIVSGNIRILKNNGWRLK